MYDLDDFIWNANLSDTLIEICDQINSEYHYSYTDYPYNWTDFQNFNLYDIEREDRCNNIEITTFIKQSSITSECTTAAELQTKIILVFAGFGGAFIFLVIIISIVLYCCICRKMGCQVWCQDKCCECCCKCKCCTRKDDETHMAQEMEFTTYE